MLYWLKIEQNSLSRFYEGSYISIPKCSVFLIQVSNIIHNGQINKFVKFRHEN